MATPLTCSSGVKRQRLLRLLRRLHDYGYDWVRRSHRRGAIHDPDDYGYGYGYGAYDDDYMAGFRSHSPHEPYLPNTWVNALRHSLDGTTLTWTSSSYPTYTYAYIDPTCFMTSVPS